MNPRYLQPSEQASPQEKRIQMFQQLQEGGQRQQQLDQQGQAGMMQMLQQLYGIQQDQQMNPLKAEQMQAQTAGLQQSVAHQQLMDPYDIAASEAATQGVRNKNASEGFDQQWAQANALRKDALDRAQIAAYGATAKANEALATHRDEPAGLPAGYPYITDPDVRAAAENRAYPELVPQRAKAAAQKAQERQAQIALDVAQQGHAQPTSAQGLPDLQSYGAKAADAIGYGLLDMPSTIYNAAGGLSDLLIGAAGVPSSTFHTSRMNPYSQIVKQHKNVFYDPKAFQPPTK